MNDTQAFAMLMNLMDGSQSQDSDDCDYGIFAHENEVVTPEETALSSPPRDTAMGDTTQLEYLPVRVIVNSPVDYLKKGRHGYFRSPLSIDRIDGPVAISRHMWELHYYCVHDVALTLTDSHGDDIEDQDSEQAQEVQLTCQTEENRGALLTVARDAEPTDIIADQNDEPDVFLFEQLIFSRARHLNQGPPEEQSHATDENLMMLTACKLLNKHQRRRLLQRICMDQNEGNEKSQANLSVDGFLAVGTLTWGFSQHASGCSDVGNDDDDDDVHGKTYKPSVSSESDTDVEENHDRESVNEEMEIATPKTMATNQESIKLSSPSKRRRKKPDTWKKNVTKKLRLEGRQYNTKKDQEERSLGPPRTSSFCYRSKLRGCTTLDQAERKSILNSFWKMGSWTERQTFVLCSVETIAKKQKKSGPRSRRHCSLSYLLKKGDGSKVTVCKESFCNTLGLSKRTVGSWIGLPNKQPSVGEDDVPKRNVKS
ncbi:hypothetical protein RRG08_032215 [Elysia crispata]|uniref:Uncharacterized protein n=1 Tax=Elysia crispata TaxID=231223 RepID=A0AAE1ABX9_9GAST|nr:hypothetical protein RRG08_032215 [Elysia crispata]